MGLKKFYRFLFANTYDYILCSSEQNTLAPRRAALLSNLRGKVLEIGSGTGANFQYYDNAVEVIAIEPSIEMLRISEKKIPSGKQITFLQAGVNDTKVQNEVKPGSLDAIVCTLVLCSVKDIEQAIANFRKWLKPEGKLVVLEHIRSAHPIKGKIQDVLNPAWRLVGDGCNLNRNTHSLIKNAGFIPEYEEYFSYNMPWYQGVFRVGV
ncbi:MAG: class I SAM-dependent methyltransferase [Bacteroidetes bacterium]|nr:class I SAM-dependent methyltransferase [Bacteroidota bacterium]